MNTFKQEPADLYAFDAKEVMDSRVNETMRQLVPIGKRQFEKFVKAEAETVSCRPFF